jgi:hypothetical protein
VNTNFKAPMTGTPLPGVSKKIRKLLLARQEVAEPIERLIAILDEIDGEAELEPTGDEEEPTLGWTAGTPRILGSTMDGEAEPSLGWTGNVNQASRNRLGDGEDYEQDDSDREPSLGSRACNPGLMMPGRDRTGDQSWWGQGGTRDLEDEHDGCEPDDDNEGTERIPGGAP